MHTIVDTHLLVLLDYQNLLKFIQNVLYYR